MSYHEHDLNRHSVSVCYGVTLKDWTLLLSVGVGGSGQCERGVSLGFLCFYFAVNWWPRDYAVPPRARVTDDPDREWAQRFERVNDAGYQIEAVDMDAAELCARATRLRNAVDVLRDLHYAKPEER